jgi:hypothetical protein
MKPICEEGLEQKQFVQKVWSETNLWRSFGAKAVCEESLQQNQIVRKVWNKINLGALSSMGVNDFGSELLASWVLWFE